MTRDKPIGKLINAMYEKREELRAETAIVNTIKAELADIESRLIETMEAVGLESSRASLATATISETSTATIDDWDSFTAWVRRNTPNRIHLFEKRIAQLAYRELLEHNRGKIPPGVTTYTRKKISLLKRS